MSEEQFDKRVTADTKACNELAAKGKSIQFHSGHQMNWEYANWIFVKNLDLPFVGIYQPISNKVFNKIFYTLRARFGTILVSTREFRSKMQQLLKTQYSIALAADQNGNPDSSYWLYFFSKPAPFVTGPDKGALRNNTAVVFVSFDKIKRGYYHFHTEVVIENANELKPGELTIKYRDFLEATIRKYPDNYLWSHRRWKNTYKSAYQNNWIDTRVKPG
jgi:KDO2-lipid IV(A) lauroyltransferase